MSFTEILKDVRDKDERYFKNLDVYMKRIKEEARKLLGDDVRAILFGSVVEGRHIEGRSDIDVLIISKNTPKRAKERAEIWTGILRGLGDPFAPFEFHVVTPKEFDEWYSKFIKKYREF